jgi:hypothetical protein
LGNLHEELDVLLCSSRAQNVWRNSYVFITANITSSRSCGEKLKVLTLCRIWGSDSRGYEEFYPLGYNVMSSVEIQRTFRRNISPAPSGLKSKSSKKPAQSRQQAKLSTLNMEAIFSPKIHWLQWTTRRYIPESKTIRTHLMLNTLFPIFLIVFGIINQMEANCSRLQFSEIGLLVMWRWREQTSPKRWYVSTKLHGFQKAVIIIFATDIRISNVTFSDLLFPLADWLCQQLSYVCHKWTSRLHVEKRKVANNAYESGELLSAKSRL